MSPIRTQWPDKIELPPILCLWYKTPFLICSNSISENAAADTKSEPNLVSLLTIPLLDIRFSWLAASSSFTAQMRSYLWAPPFSANSDEETSNLEPLLSHQSSRNPLSSTSVGQTDCVSGLIWWQHSKVMEKLCCWSTHIQAKIQDKDILEFIITSYHRLTF